MVRFDAYTCTVQGPSVLEAVAMLRAGGFDQVREGKGYHTFGHRVSVKDETGEEVGAVSYGGRQAGRLMVEVKGERTPWTVDNVRREWREHRCTRVDSCADFERPGAFEALLDPVMRAKADFKLYGERRGDWDMPELGRTQYLGANSSPVRLRLYEKGKQPEYRHLNRPHLARLEIQVRPQKDAKTAYARLDPLQVWGASKFTRQLAAEVLEAMLDPYPPGTVRKDSKRDQAMRWMCRQYGPHMLSLREDLGSWECVGLTLEEMIREEQARSRGVT